MQTANWAFRWVVCELSRAEVVAITGRSLRTVRAWDAGAKIPREMADLMLANARRRPISNHPSWEGWHTRGPHLITAAGEAYEAHEIRTAVWLMREWLRTGETPAQWWLKNRQNDR